METKTNPASPRSLAAALEAALLSGGVSGPSIGSISGQVQEKGFGLLLLVLALPSALPVPAPGYSTPFGIVIALIALQMIFGRSTVWLPQRLAAARIEPQTAQKMLGFAARIFHFIERFIRPRQYWIRRRAGQVALALVILIMALLMILPIPLTNTFPALVIFLIGVGLSEEDGLLAIGAFILGCLAVLLYAGIVYLVITQGPEVIDAFKEWVKRLFA